MKRILFTVLLAFVGFCMAIPVQARDGVSIGLGCCGGGYYPSHYYNPYYSPYYGYPPPYYYAPPPTVVYAEPAPTTYVVQQPAPDAPPQAASQYNAAPPPSAADAAPTFTDKKGRTCRKFQTSIDGTVVNGTACLQPDGSWRSVEE